MAAELPPWRIERARPLALLFAGLPHTRIGKLLAGIGGRAFDENLRQRLTYCCYCDTMKQLDAFARSMRSMSVSQPA